LRSFDWNAGPDGTRSASGPLALLDETLRDGLQSPSVRQPSLEEKIVLLHLMDGLGITTANVGYPGAGERAQSDAEALCREIACSRLSIAAKCAGRTCAEDVIPVVELAQRVGLPLEMGMFLGSSPIRRYAEGWSRRRLLRMTDRWVSFARDRGLGVMFVTEDTTRSRPDDLAQLYRTAVRAGACRVCLADTVGCATPSAVGALVRFARATLDSAGGSEVALDWHGHDDRGLAVANALEAARAGADRLHGTALGVGERVGNAAIERLLLNAAALGWARPNLERLPAYLRAAASALHVEIGAGTVAAMSYEEENGDRRTPISGSAAV
jgi:isopropylmalate/homocitrate/citramalate synthase